MMGFLYGVESLYNQETVVDGWAPDGQESLREGRRLSMSYLLFVCRNLPSPLVVSQT